MTTFLVASLLEKHDRAIQRILEIIPGLLTWAALTAPIWMAFKLPAPLAFFLTFLAVFWVYRAILHTIGIIIGYRRYRQEMKIDWLKKCQKLNFKTLPDQKTLPKSLNDLKHFILIPAVNESFEVLDNTFGAVAKSNYPKESVYVALTVEEKGAKEVKESFEKIKKKYPGLRHLMLFVHPPGIPGEAVGAAANRTWGARHTVEQLKKEKIPVKDVLFTTFDADARVHPQFLARVAYQYLTTKNRKHKFYQTAVYLHDNNIWDVPPLMRIQGNSVTMAVLSSWVVEPSLIETFSGYSVPLETIIKANYWDVDLGVDDTTFYWRGFFLYDGDFKGEGFYIPTYNDAVQGATAIKSHVSQYKQLLRWGWGVIAFPIAMKGLLKNKGIPLSTKFLKFVKLIEQHTVWTTTVFLITFGFLIFTAVNPKVSQMTIGHQVPILTGKLLTAAILLLVPLTLFRDKLVAPKPKHWPWWKKALTYLEGLLVILNLLTYTFIPYVDAETRLMLGKRLEFWHTPKVRKSKP